MKITVLILILILVLIYLNNKKENFEGTTVDENLMIIVLSDGFYYLNIKNSETNKFDVYRIPLDLIKNFYK
jgi:hypothetical protein